MAFSPQVVRVSLECLEGRDKGKEAGQGRKGADGARKGWMTYEIIRVGDGLSHWTMWAFLTDELLWGFQPPTQS